MPRKPKGKTIIWLDNIDFGNGGEGQDRFQMMEGKLEDEEKWMGDGIEVGERRFQGEKTGQVTDQKLCFLCQQHPACNFPDIHVKIGSIWKVIGCSS